MDAAIIETVLDQIAAGVTLRELSRRPEYPSINTIRHHLVRDAALAERYARARMLQLDNWADEIIEIADDGRNDWMRRNADGDFIGDRESVERSRQRIEARKWLLSKLRPERYGDRLEVTGRDGGPIALSVVDDAELARRVALLLARASQAMLPPARELDGECQEIGAPHSEGDG